MKKILVALCLTCALAIAAHAADAPEGAKPDAKPSRPAPTAEQKAFRKSLVEKYDANKNGKLDADERANITEEERAKAGYAPPKPKKEKPAA